MHVTVTDCKNAIAKNVRAVFKRGTDHVTDCLTKCFTRVLKRFSRVYPCLIFDDLVLFYGTVLHEDYRHRSLSFRVAELAPKYHVWLSPARQLALFSQIKQYISRIYRSVDQNIGLNVSTSENLSVQYPQRTTIEIGRVNAATLYAPDDDFRKRYLEVIRLVLDTTSKHLQNYLRSGRSPLYSDQFVYETTRTYWGILSKLIHLLVTDIRGGLIFRNPARWALLTEISNDLVLAQDRCAVIDLSLVVQEVFDEMYKREDYCVAHRVGTRQENCTICPYYPKDTDPKGDFNVVR